MDLRLDRKIFHELRAMSKPPPGVLESIEASLLLLGYPADDLKGWKACLKILIQFHVGSLLEKMSTFDPAYCFTDVAEKAKAKLEPYTLEQIYSKSLGAAYFFSWCERMIAEVERSGGMQRQKKQKK